MLKKYSSVLEILHDLVDAIVTYSDPEVGKQLILRDPQPVWCSLCSLQTVNSQILSVSKQDVFLPNTDAATSAGYMFMNSL